MKSTIRKSIWLALSFAPLTGFAAIGADSTLVEAVKHRDSAAVQSLLKQHADVNAPQRDGATALTWAAHWDDLETARLLIRAGGKIDAANEYGVTPLWEACNNASTSMVEELAKDGANANVTLPGTGETPLMRCAATGNADAVKALVAHGAKVNVREPHKGQTALMWAIEQGHPEAARALIESGADVKASSNSGFSPLMFAARQGDIETGRLLLEKGADINYRWAGQVPTEPDKVPEGGFVYYVNLNDPENHSYSNPRGAQGALTALLVATDCGQEAFAKFLAEKGADLNATDAEGYTALHYALRRGITILRFMGKHERYEDPFEYLLRPDLTELIKTLLDHGANPNARIVKGTRFSAMGSVADWPQVGLAGGTPLLLAAAEGNAAVMRILINKGADPKLATDDGTTPLMAAAGVGRNGKFDRTKDEERQAVEAVKLLLSLGVDPNARNKDGYTAAMGAAFTGGSDILQALVEGGAKLNVTDRFGQTPLSIAEGDPNNLVDVSEQSYHPATAELIRKLGAFPLPRPGRRQTAADLNVQAAQ